MSSKSHSATMEKINDPAPKTSRSNPKSSASKPERRTVAPTPGAESHGTSHEPSAAERDEASMLDTAKQEAAARADQMKAGAADHAADQADRLKEAGNSFGDDSFAQQAAHGLADNLHHAADAVRDADLGALANDVATFARRQPVLFFGGAALLGFAAARMMKASERSDGPGRG